MPRTNIRYVCYHVARKKKWAKDRAEWVEAWYKQRDATGEGFWRAYVWRRHARVLQTLLDGQNTKLYMAARERDRLIRRVRELETTLRSVSETAAACTARQPGTVGAEASSF